MTPNPIAPLADQKIAVSSIFAAFHRRSNPAQFTCVSRQNALRAGGFGQYRIAPPLDREFSGASVYIVNPTLLGLARPRRRHAGKAGLALHRAKREDATKARVRRSVCEWYPSRSCCDTSNARISRS